MGVVIGVYLSAIPGLSLAIVAQHILIIEDLVLAETINRRHGRNKANDFLNKLAFLCDAAPSPP